VKKNIYQGFLRPRFRTASAGFGRWADFSRYLLLGNEQPFLPGTSLAAAATRGTVTLRALGWCRGEFSRQFVEEKRNKRQRSPEADL
jgi:hypothetical protein